MEFQVQQRGALEQRERPLERKADGIDARMLEKADGLRQLHSQGRRDFIPCQWFGGPQRAGREELGQRPVGIPGGWKGSQGRVDRAEDALVVLDDLPLWIAKRSGSRDHTSGRRRGLMTSVTRSHRPVNQARDRANIANAVATRANSACTKRLVDPGSRYMFVFPCRSWSLVPAF